MEPDEVFLGIGCPVTTTWPNDTYEFIYRTYSCGIANKVRRNTRVYGPFLGSTKWKL
jgi:hypothetical protein